MLRTPMNEWILKAVQIETALLALGEIELPAQVHGLQNEARDKVRALLTAWKARKPAEEKREWKQETLEKGKPQDEELLGMVQELKKESADFTVYRYTSGSDTVETLVAGSQAWMAAGGEYYFGQWDEDEKVLEVGRDDEHDEPGSGLVLKLTGELVHTFSDEA
ncbi:hypothetical protein [Stigmatella aurantiaca]|uniref:Conserved uncharacterized protein n=1 Tax=Stigmatella aurantiaca (strain DW4/3-1) TaxID=378806 RepID=Q092B9_STIAD|nr:hypothetical protein [Stigmatella aurantiaca]ADO75735.1 conserved uncharacterized protein [Stigmatella aurantiaca DW4/3-1]EAU66576.1 hypothetical protein STIAU_3431 [Stigmatella aurantiaca DW4/3-1]